MTQPTKRSITSMKSLPAALRALTVTYSTQDLLIVALIATCAAVWIAVAGGAFSLLALLACHIVFFAFYLVGSLFAAWSSLALDIRFDFPLRLLVGYVLVNTLLLVLAWLTPFSILTNFASVVGVAVVVLLLAQLRKQKASDTASVWAAVICLLATTLWCQDSIHPISERNHIVLMKPWVDGFYHAVHIRLFSAGHGAATIEYFRMAGVPARLYHYGAYLTPALVKNISGIHSYTVFAGFLAPVGVLFTGLAAYTFFGSFWGAWPGVAAAAALMLFPDGTQQGVANTFMSYHWLTQISPSATLGLVVLAVAWLFVIRGCTRGNRLQLYAGWFVSALVLFYKLHYLIASALLLLLIPPVFFKAQLGGFKRALWALAAGAAYVAAVIVGKKVPGVPLIRFDGSSTGEILRLILSFAKPGPLHDMLRQHMGPNFARTSNLLFGIPYVLLATFGIGVPILVALIIALRRRVAPVLLLFPLLLIVNFLAMFFGLALDFSRSTPDELSHRPLMVVYFFVMPWIGAAAGLVLSESKRLRRFARPVVFGVAALLIVVPAHFGPGVQLMWAMPRISPVKLPSVLVRMADYIREHGGTDDVFQDSQFDIAYTIAALSERRTFVSHTMTSMPYRSDMVEIRTEAIERFKHIRQPKLVTATARALGFRWFLLEPGDRVDWPAEIAESPIYKIGSHRLYCF